MIQLNYDKGTILIRGDMRIPNSYWDSRSNTYRALAMHYRNIIDYLRRSNIEFSDEVLDLIPCPTLSSNLKLRDYQRDALKTWIDTGRNGVIVLPTGAGKTVIAIEAMARFSMPTLVVVPTLDLVDQWRTKLSEEFNTEIGVYGGGEHILRPITVATYDTAYLRAEELGNKFYFMVFDEVHHLPSSGYMQIAEMYATPYRLGLTATYEREDGLHEKLTKLVGGKVFEMSVERLVGKHLSNYTLKRVKTELTPEEVEEYEKQHHIYTNYLRTHNIVLRTPKDFQYFVMRTGRDTKAREALLARHRARMIALNSRSKLDKLREILEKHHSDRILIFTEHNLLVQEISKRFLVPSITHKTPRDERTEILDNFRSDKYRVIVTSKVLDEGIDVPEANVAVVLSGSGSSREFIQRLGRILRKKEGKNAIMYEVVSRKTSEVGTSRKRRIGMGANASI
ncbi:MAG: DEAD/DEAH box helicase family protein [Methanocellales archaeon]|nr:DEAD/DEAH box helicase family protein [Methanocellales archaeon]